MQLKKHRIKRRPNARKTGKTTRALRIAQGVCGKWFEEDMKCSMEAVRGQTLGFNEAARKFNVPRATLHRHLDGKNVRAHDGRKLLGRSCDLPSALCVENLMKRTGCSVKYANAGRMKIVQT